MAQETEDEYVARRFREARPYEKENLWHAPDRWDRPAEILGTDGGNAGNGSHSIPKFPTSDPIINGVPGNNGSAGGSLQLIATINGSSFYVNFNATVGSPV